MRPFPADWMRMWPISTRVTTTHQLSSPSNWRPTLRRGCGHQCRLAEVQRKLAPKSGPFVYRFRTCSDDASAPESILAVTSALPLAKLSFKRPHRPLGSAAETAIPAIITLSRRSFHSSGVKFDLFRHGLTSTCLLRGRFISHRASG